jgi:hypothetical protein
MEVPASKKEGRRSGSEGVELACEVVSISMEIIILGWQNTFTTGRKGWVMV